MTNPVRATAASAPATGGHHRGQTTALIAGRWILLLAVSSAAWWGFDNAGLTAPALFGALLVAILLAVAGVRPDPPPRIAGVAAQGILAVTIGLSVTPEIADTLSQQWPPVMAVALSTLVASVVAGVLLARHRLVDTTTGVLSMIAGGATGLSAVADELGADQRVVVVTQYLRVAMVVLTMPLVVTYIFSADAPPHPATSPDPSAAPWWVGVGFTTIVVIAATGAATILRLPIPATLGPLIVTAAIELSGWSQTIALPPWLLAAAFLLIGWQAGLTFTRTSVAALGRIFGWALSLTIVLNLICAALGLALAAWTHTSALQGYLATTPGGLAAVLAVATTTDTDPTLIAASQVIRLVLVLLATPAVLWLIGRRRSSETS